MSTNQISLPLMNYSSFCRKSGFSRPFFSQIRIVHISQLRCYRPATWHRVENKILMLQARLKEADHHVVTQWDNCWTAMCKYAHVLWTCCRDLGKQLSLCARRQLLEIELVSFWPDKGKRVSGSEENKKKHKRLLPLWNIKVQQDRWVDPELISLSQNKGNNVRNRSWRKKHSKVYKVEKNMQIIL